MGRLSRKGLIYNYCLFKRGIQQMLGGTRRDRHTDNRKNDGEHKPGVKSRLFIYLLQRVGLIANDIWTTRL